MNWIRVCQECGSENKTAPPKVPMTNNYRDKHCKNCGSAALDYGYDRDAVSQDEE